MSTDAYGVIKRPIITERSNLLREENNQYAFEVAPTANKVQIRQAIEKIFGVRVMDVRTINVRGKIKRMRRGFGKKPNWKKAIVTLREEDTIEIFEGV